MSKCITCFVIQEISKDPFDICHQCELDATTAHEKAVEVMNQMRPKRKHKGGKIEPIKTSKTVR